MGSTVKMGWLYAAVARAKVDELNTGVTEKLNISQLIRDPN